MSTNSDVLLAGESGPIATITLNRPSKRNALTRMMLNLVLDAFDRLDDASDVRVVILRSAGDTFCAGIDLGEMLKERQEVGSINHDQLQCVFRRLQQHRNPVVAQVQGPALAGGCELALHCDLRIASPPATFGMPLARIGIVVPFVLAQRLARIAGVTVAADLLVTGEPVDAARAHQCGIVSRLVPAALLETTVETVAKRIASNAPLAVRAMKRISTAIVDGAADGVETLEATRKQVSASDDAREGLNAFLERRTPLFKAV